MCGESKYPTERLCDRSEQEALKHGEGEGRMKNETWGRGKGLEKQRDTALNERTHKKRAHTLRGTTCEKKTEGVL